MSEENKPEERQESEENDKECCGGHEHTMGCGGHHGQWGHGGGHWMHRRMMMHYASMSVEEEVEFLESVKARLEDRLATVNEKLGKLKA